MSRSSAVSVVMAAWQGQRWLCEQLDSILCQMEADDELIISVDPSTDATWQIARSYQQQDHRIRLLAGPGQGVIANFENGLQAVHRPIVVLSDQDDVWVQGKLETIRNVFARPQVMALVHDARICKEDLSVAEPSFFASHHSQPGFAANVMRNSFMGACMAFRKEVLRTALPFPRQISMHDQWIGLCAMKLGQVEWIDQPFLLYRRHEDNASQLSPEGGLVHQVYEKLSASGSASHSLCQLVSSRLKLLQALAILEHRL